MEAFLVSLSTVAIAEMGDRTQLLALVLAAKFRKPLPIIAAILLATVANHALAGLVGIWFAKYLTPKIVDIVVGVSLIGMAAWSLVPDKLDDAEKQRDGRGAFLATLIAFFTCEMGDKTQIATAALAAGYSNIVAVVAGSTLGMMAANVPVVLMGNSFAARLPMDRIHKAAAVLFALLGVWFIARALL
ncbi:MAG TPA: TMEM165/GDT1 family protein [Rhizomicrobium sp.]|nr:TMEM165/GDT1 family protein [Rhizomicrobium sp.]